MNPGTPKRSNFEEGRIVTRDEARFRRVEAENRALNQQELARGEEVLSSYPPFFQIDLIGVCDMKPYCRMCTIDISHTRAHGGMEIEQLRGFAPFVEASRQVTNCSTGEPLLHRHLWQLLDFTSERGTRFGFSSNGLALDADRAERLLEYGEHLAINFSLDAATAATYAKIRCNDFDRVLANIRHFCARRSELPIERRPEVGLCFIPMRLNRHEVSAFFDLALELEADHVELRPLIRLPINKIVTHDGFTFNYDEEVLSWSELQDCQRRALEASARTGIRLDWQYETETDEAEERAPYVLFEQAEARHVEPPCTMPWTFLLPYENGDTVPCCYMSSSVGNWRQEGLEEVWNGPVLRSIRRTLARGELAGECWKSASCPVVKQIQHRGAAERRSAYLARAARPDGEVVFHAGDPELQELIEFGIFEEEQGEGRSFRWIADFGRLELPNPFPGRPVEVMLQLRDGRWDETPPTPICRLRINGVWVGEVDASWGLPRPWMHFDADRSDRLCFDFECPNAFVPGRRGGTHDTRALGVVLYEIRIRPAVGHPRGIRRRLGALADGARHRVRNLLQGTRPST